MLETRTKSVLVPDRNISLRIGKFVESQLNDNIPNPQIGSSIILLIFKKQNSFELSSFRAYWQRIHVNKW